MVSTKDSSAIKDRIINDSYDIPMAEILVDGYVYSFSLSPVQEDNRKWLIGVLGKQMREIHERAYTKGKAETQQAVKDALGIR